MIEAELKAQSEALLAQLHGVNPEAQHKLMPEIQAHLRACRGNGMTPDARLVQIEHNLHDEDVEDFFDNIPV